VLEISRKRGKSGEMQKIYQEMSQHLQLQKFVSNPDGQKNNFFLLRLKIIIIKLCDVFLWKKKNLFLKHKIILKTYFRIAYIS